MFTARASARWLGCGVPTRGLQDILRSGFSIPIRESVWWMSSLSKSTKACSSDHPLANQQSQRLERSRWSCRLRPVALSKSADRLSRRKSGWSAAGGLRSYQRKRHSAGLHAVGSKCQSRSLNRDTRQLSASRRLDRRRGKHKAHRFSLAALQAINIAARAERACPGDLEHAAQSASSGSDTRTNQVYLQLSVRPQT
jgi:hypothetical protein